jgi:hypothetical protein
MKQAADKFTRDMIDKPGRGRSRKPDAKTPAQRAREYRARKKFNFLNFVTGHENSGEVA